MADYDEKNGNVAISPTASSQEKPVRKGSIAAGEAADMYGDIQTAEEYGYVSRG